MADDITSRLDDLAVRVDEAYREISFLRDELKSIRSKMDQPKEYTPIIAKPAPSPKIAEPIETVKKVTPPTEGPPQYLRDTRAAQPSEAIESSLTCKLAASSINWESVIGANWLNRIGVIILLLAGAFLAHLSWQRGWVSPMVQTAAIFAVGIAMLAAGEVFQRRALPVFAQGLTSLGILALYAGGLVGHHLHHLLPLQATFLVYIIITAGSFLIAARTNSIAVVLLGMLGGYLTPIILSTGQDAVVELFVYLLFLNAAIAATAIAKRWEFLMPIAFAATAAMFVGWFATFYEPPKRWTIETMLSLHAALFMIVAVVPYAVLGRPSSRLSQWMLSKTSLTFFGTTYLLFKPVPEHWLGEFAALYGTGHWLLSAAIYSYRRQRERLLAYLMGLGAIFVTLAVPIYFSAHARGIAWAVQALVFTVIGIRYRSVKTLASAVIVYALALWATGCQDIIGEMRGQWWGWLDIRFGTALIVAAFIAGGGLAYHFGRRRIQELSSVNSSLLPFMFLAIADLLAILTSPHQFIDHHLALAWTVNAVAVCGTARWRRSAVAQWFGLLLLLPTFVRFIQFQVLTAPTEVWFWQIDLRFAQGLFVVAGACLTAFLARENRDWCDLPKRESLGIVASLIMLLIVTQLQWQDAVLTSIWALEVFALAAFARWQNVSKVAWCSAVGLAWLGTVWLGTDIMKGAALVSYPSVKAAFASGLAITAAGWLSALLFRKRRPEHLASLLALATNLVLLVTIGHQWDGYLCLTLWTINVAALWAVGFTTRHAGARAEAMALWIVLLGGWIYIFGQDWPKPLDEFTLLLNARFGAIALVSIVGFAATWAYRRFADELTGIWLPRMSNRISESKVHWICVVLASLILVGALTLDVNTLYDQFERRGVNYFEDVVMARQATLSILWASFAAILIIMGFVVRYAPIRILAMVSFAPILLKVFMVDLRNLDVIYRVLSFAVLGIVFVGISYLYQRYRTRLGWDLTGTDR